ncbi:hypothetical protein Gasu2_11240 [Galdieria sulphuraria]|nr:hypothetical protein Gasu2_11240 [Galdieria sulphuraria]
MLRFLSKEVRFLQQTTGQYSSELNQWFDYQVETLNPTAQKLVKKSRDMARKTWQNLLSAVDANKILTDHVASEFDRYFHLSDIYLYHVFYLFSLVSGMDPLVLIQRHYENVLGIFVMTTMMSLLVLGGCFCILYWRQRYQNALSSLFGIGSIMFHFYGCILKPALMDDPLAAIGSIYLIYCSILYFITVDFLPLASWNFHQNFQKWFVVTKIRPKKLYCAICENRKYFWSQFGCISSQKLLNDVIKIHWRIRDKVYKCSIEIGRLLTKLNKFITKKRKSVTYSLFCSQSPKLMAIATSSPNSISTCKYTHYERSLLLRRENSSNSLRNMPW